MTEFDLDPTVEDLLAPTLDAVRRTAATLGQGALAVRQGPVDGFYSLSGATVVLSDRLSGPDLHHPLDAEADVPLDRWRRAAASVLEAVALRSLQQRVGREPLADWRWLGAAIWQVDRAFPELQVAIADLARARRSASPGRVPRAGLGVVRALEHRGEDALARMLAWLGDEPISPSEFLELGRWVLATDGAQAELPVPVRRPAPVDIPTTVPAFSWVALAVPPSPRGGFVRVDGPGAIDNPWGVHDRPLETLAAATDGEVRLLAESGGPLGTWALRSADGFGQVMGARGFTFEFTAHGVLRLVLADAFVGPIAALEMAERVGTSGIVRGRWRVAGPQAVELSDLDTSALTMHGHDVQGTDDPFVLPAQGLGLAQSIRSMSESVWRWRVSGTDLFLTGSIQRTSIEVRLERA